MLLNKYQTAVNGNDEGLINYTSFLKLGSLTEKKYK